MLNILKMDIHRILHSKVFYVSLAFLTLMAVTMPLSGMSTTLPAMLGISDAASGEAFMSASTGTGVISILIGIVLTLFICGDYSGGFSKNLFSFHADTKDYVFGKMASMLILSALLLVVYTIESVIVLAVMGYGVVLEGGVIGLLLFLVQKWIVSGAFIALIMLICLTTRNTAVGVIAGFLVATGGLTMGLVLFGDMLGIDIFQTISTFTISGASGLATLSFDALTFVQILLVSAVWMVACIFLSRTTLKTKDAV